MTTSIFERARETSPYRWLLIATLAAIALALSVSMALVTQSQVRKAEAHYAVERTNVAATASSPAAAPAARASRQTPVHGVMNVGYVAGR